MTDTSGSFVFQKGLFAKLAADGGLTDLGILGSPMRIHDEPPAGAVFPFITIGDDSLEDWGARDVTGYGGSFSVHAWSQGERGRSTVKKLADAIRNALHEQDIDVEDHSVVLCRFLSSNTDTPDGSSWHAETKFKIILQSN